MEEGFPLLIVEDSPTQALRLQTVLESLGYQVAVADNGRAALEEVLREFRPLVITDWVMPEMDGLDFCQAIRKLDLPGYVYVILLTARDALDDVVAGLEAGADDYLTKPVHPAELAARLKTARRILNLEAALRKRNEEIQKLSITDPLTTLFNRRYFNEELPKALSASARTGRPLAVLMADIDHFKKVNDTHGHQVGDQTLRAFGRLLKEGLRKGVDWAARYGGEEFAVVLGETDLDGAVSAAERLRLLTSGLTLEAPTGPFRVTASFGVACADPRRGDVPSMEKLVAAADRALYTAKETGRNRVEAAHDSP
ncbi:response regulator receiver modulated diguanylate cyclase [Desulfacinum hydrothermale DSM 13146]|uniref:diguanylate cyclase n=1 Tax=Desulfacinum hydrothermale DSM 13146 TaxID=1121390 RepID=A0A1W1XBC8_9BACT|nr:diguanylate cyclase [Desulfacinum hydrothermale]SMC20821.1 response regulator receiver modulated diguanylate cyclase [Desulfacinum hydrothermale DSM 13146]